jgi:hypothetical protein
MKRRAQSLLEYALIAVPVVAAAALLQSTLLPTIGELLDSITQAVLSLRV